MNNEVMFSSKTDLWATPQAFFDELNREFGFTLDVAAAPENAKCEKFYTKEQDGLVQPWDGTVWCNPPYGRTVGDWVRKAYETHVRGGATRWLCCCLPELIHGGSMSTYTAKRRYGL